jgi:hypothetical protein
MVYIRALVKPAAMFLVLAAIFTLVGPKEASAVSTCCIANRQCSAYYYECSGSYIACLPANCPAALGCTSGSPGACGSTGVCANAKHGSGTNCAEGPC